MALPGSVWRLSNSPLEAISQRLCVVCDSQMAIYVVELAPDALERHLPWSGIHNEPG